MNIWKMSAIFLFYLSEGRKVYISDSYQEAFNVNKACSELFYQSDDSFINITNSPLFADKAWTGNSLNATNGTCIAFVINSTGELVFSYTTDCKKLLPVLCAKLNEHPLTLQTSAKTTVLHDFKMGTIFLILCIIAAVIGFLGIFIAVWCVRRRNQQKVTGSIKEPSVECDAAEAIKMSVLESNNAYTDIDTKSSIAAGDILDDAAYHELDHSRKDHLEDKSINVYDHQQSIRNRDGIYDLSGETQPAILKHDSNNYDLVNVSLSMKLNDQNLQL